MTKGQAVRKHRGQLQQHHRASGFTLMELVLVLVMMAILLGLAAPSLRGFGRGAKLRDARDEMLAAARWARSQAAVTARVHRMEFSQSDGRFRIVQEDAGEFVEAAWPYATEKTLREGFRLSVEGDDGGLADSVEFYPNGRVTPARIRVVAPWGDEAEIVCATAAVGFRIGEEAR